MKIEHDGICLESSEDEHKITLYIPVDVKSALAVEPGGVITATIKGKVVRVSATAESEYEAPGSITLEVDGIKIDGKSVFDDLAD
jgi:hypothetical protein